MPEGIAGLEMHPHLGLRLAGRIRDENDPVTGHHAFEVPVPTSEYGAVDGRAEVLRPATRERWASVTHRVSLGDVEVQASEEER